MKGYRFWLAAMLLSALCASIYISAGDRIMVWGTSTATAKAPIESKLASLGKANAWLNSQPLSAADLRGKVVLVDFWTYSCINWLRTMPYLRAWGQKYRDHGLVIIGAHTPEFSFEKNVDNVVRAAKELKVDYPIAIDSDYAIWNAFSNQYWPALYFIDAQGRVRHQHFGEGNYDQLEVTIQQLLVEAGHNGFDRTLVSALGQGVELAADWNSLGTPETYVGYGRAERFASLGEPLFDRPRVYTAPARMNANAWALIGDWTMKRESAALNKANGKISYRFRARDLHLVMATAQLGTPVRFRVSIDGQPPGTSHGVDVDDAGNGTIDEPRMYQLIRQSGPIRDRQFDIEFLDSGAEVFVFTFG